MADIVKKAKKNRVLLLCGLAVLALIVLIAVRLVRGRGASAGSSEDAAYVMSVGELTGQYASDGVFNRFSGVVESQETKAFNKRDDAEIDEIFVGTGDAVAVGTPLFSYSIEKYEEDLAKAEIDLERLHNDLTSISNTIAQLEKDSRSASASERANYTVQIQEQQINYRQQEYDIQSKELEIEKLKDNIAHATVTSDMEGIVKSINKDSSSQPYPGSGEEGGFIVIMKTGDYRVKGSVNEQNVYDVSEDMPVIVHSRLDDTVTWRGVITSVDRENTNSSENMYGEGPGSSSYPFYVDLASSEGLLMGQHVYLEIDHGQGAEGRQGLWLDEYMIDLTDPEAPFVWAMDGRGRLEKRKIRLGEYDSELLQYQILEGLTAEDSIAFPDASLKEGMSCVTEMPMEPDMETDMETEPGMDMEPETGMEPGTDMEPETGMEPGAEMEPEEGMEH